MYRIEDTGEEDVGGTRPLPLRCRSRLGADGKQPRSRFDVFTGIAFSNVVMFAIIGATAITLTPKSGQHVVISSQFLCSPEPTQQDWLAFSASQQGFPTRHAVHRHSMDCAQSGRSQNEMAQSDQGTRSPGIIRNPTRLCGDP